MNDWKNYIDLNGNFELPNFLYKTINELMKQALDMGTLLSDDQYKLRAYKEQTKKLFKKIQKSIDLINIFKINKINAHNPEEQSKINKPPLKF